MKSFLVFSLLWLAWAAPCESALLTGKATLRGDAVAGVRVMAYPVDVLTFAGPVEYQSEASSADGLFALTLPAGQYYLLAKGKNLAAYYGRNPISVPEQGLENINLLMTSDRLSAEPESVAIETGAAGYVSQNGVPVENAIVTVYADLTSQLKGMGLAMAAPTDAQGYFELPLSAGTYYLVVRVRQSGQMAGPLQSGDLFGYLPGNPLVVNPDSVSYVHIPVIEVPEKVSRHAATLFGNTLIKGQVLDAAGKPAAGVQVLLYEDPMMLNRPLYVSAKTDAMGHYQLSFPQGGHYYLAARSELGGTPGPGELYGRYQGSPDHSIRIETGKVLGGIEIVVEEVY